MKRNKLKYAKKNLVPTLLEHNGLFCEHIPYCFSTSSLANVYPAIANDFAKLSVATSFPLNFTISKNSILRRTISVPNIIAFIKLLEIYKDNWDDICDKALSRHSESQLNKIIPLIYQVDFTRSIKSRNNKFVGYKVKLNLDISNFFDSIYTHSITWALVGKEEAKKIFNKKLAASPLYLIGQKIDNAIRKMNGDQTNGILTGPYSSNIFSEIILAEIDRILQDEMQFEFTRFVDDYGFYFLTHAEAEAAIDQIAGVLKSYNLTVNNEKVKIENFPYDLLDDFKNEFYDGTELKDAVMVLNNSLKLYKQGYKGAIKYALTALINQSVVVKNDTALNMSLNIMLNLPETSRLVMQFLEKNMGNSYIRKHAYRINKLLIGELKAQHIHESMWLMYLLVKSDSPIFIDNIIKAIESENDLLILLCLDAIHNNTKKIYDYNNKFYGSIVAIIPQLNDSCKIISQLIKDEDFTGTHWLLAYEVAHNDWRVNKQINIYKIRNYSFYKLLSGHNVKFYDKNYTAD